MRRWVSDESHIAHLENFVVLTMPMSRFEAVSRFYAQPHLPVSRKRPIAMHALTYRVPENTMFDVAVHGPRMADAATSNAAFFSSSGINALRRFNRVLCRAAPSAAAVFARRPIGTPPRHAPRKGELELAERAQSSSVVVGRRTISVAAWGQGETVLLVHSWRGRGTQMSRFVEPPTHAGCRVVSFDLPAHGNAGTGETDMVECAAAVDAVARAESGSGHPVTAIIAHSFGVMAALLASREHGFNIPTLISIGAFESCRWFIDAAKNHLALSDEMAKRIRDNFEAKHGYRVTWDQLPVVEMLRAFRAKTLVIHDRFDREIPYEHSYALRSVGSPGQMIDYFRTVGLGHRRSLADAAVIARSVSCLSNCS